MSLPVCQGSGVAGFCDHEKGPGVVRATAHSCPAPHRELQPGVKAVQVVLRYELHPACLPRHSDTAQHAVCSVLPWPAVIAQTFPVLCPRLHIPAAPSTRVLCSP